MSWVQCSSDPNYKEALTATDSLGIPKGFTFTKELETPVKASPILASQNNVQLYLILKTLEKVEKIELRLERLEEKLTGKSSNPEISSALEDLKQSLGRIKITESAPPKAIRKVFFLNDPKKILEEEQKKKKMQ